MVLKPVQIREMSDDELRQKIDLLGQELYQLRTQARSGRIDKPHKISQTRKELARVLTILNERKRGTDAERHAEQTRKSE